MPAHVYLRLFVAAKAGIPACGLLAQHPDEGRCRVFHGFAYIGLGNMTLALLSGSENCNAHWSLFGVS